MDKLDYLSKLGINAIELLPVQEFNELEYYQVWPCTQLFALPLLLKYTVSVSVSVSKLGFQNPEMQSIPHTCFLCIPALTAQAISLCKVLAADLLKCTVMSKRIMYSSLHIWHVLQISASLF